jgi:hypothetical protein
MTGFLLPEVLETFPDENGTNFVQAASAVGFSASTPQVGAGNEQAPYQRQCHGNCQSMLA